MNEIMPTVDKFEKDEVLKAKMKRIRALNDDINLFVSSRSREVSLMILETFSKEELEKLTAVERVQVLRGVSDTYKVFGNKVDNAIQMNQFVMTEEELDRFFSRTKRVDGGTDSGQGQTHDSRTSA